VIIPGSTKQKSHIPEPVYSPAQSPGYSSLAGCLSRLPFHFITSAVHTNKVASRDIYTASLTNKMPTLSKRLAHADGIRPDSSITNIEGFRGFEKVLDELRGVFGEEVLGQVADGAMTKAAPCSCLACEGEDGEIC
jgi:hypothetical protein